MDKTSYAWCIAYINRVFMETLVKDLVNSGFGDIRFSIPTVKVLKKKFKGKDFYDEVPLLFNYGFFRLSMANAANRDYLMRLRAAVPCIYNWLYKTGVGGVEYTQTLVGVESGEEFERTRLTAPLLVHTVRTREIAVLKRIALETSIYCSKDVKGLTEGTYIVLRGYPFENIPAQVVSVHPTKEKVKVRLLVEGNMGEAEVDFSNIFYSIYSDPDEPTPSDQTVEGLMSKYQIRSDKILREDD